MTPTPTLTKGGSLITKYEWKVILLLLYYYMWAKHTPLPP